MTRLLTLGCALVALAAAIGISNQAAGERVAFVERDSALFLAPAAVPPR